jgi:hypothetical protein
VVKVLRGTEAGDAPDRPGDERDYREYVNEEPRSLTECRAGRMQPDFHHGLRGLEILTIGPTRPCARDCSSVVKR